MTVLNKEFLKSKWVSILLAQPNFSTRWAQKITFRSNKSLSRIYIGSPIQLMRGHGLAR